jgi:methanethiol S-methyltransferase
LLRRVIFFAIGAVAYALFTATMLYGIGFVGNFAVAKAIDSGPVGPWPQAVAVDLGLIALFGVQHSVMARPAFKRACRNAVPAPLERSAYVLLSSACFALLCWCWRPLPATVWDASGTVLGVALTALFWLGWVLEIASTYLIDHFDLFGLRQVWLFLRGVAYTPPAFEQPLVYRYVRHPLMLCLLIAFWATPRMSVGHLLFAAGSTLYILIGIAFEERDLLAEHGEPYAAYRARVSMLVPLRLRR